jgi:hypothetical protein
MQIKAVVNGRPVAAELDSGAEVSLIDTSIAAAAGVSRTGGDALIDPVKGSGPKPEESWVGRFDSFALGDEKIAHVNIQVVNIMRGERLTGTGSLIPYQASDTALLVGADFLHAHRVMVDNADHLILFSYEGGPVFNTGHEAPSVK